MKVVNHVRKISDYFMLKDNCKVYRLMLQLERSHFKEKDRE